MVAVLALGLEHELELARVLSPGGEQPVTRRGRGAVIAAAQALRTGREQARPQRRRGVQDKHVNLARLGEGRQDLEVAGGQARYPEQRDPARQSHDCRVLAQARAGRLDPLGRAWNREALAHPAPQLRLPDARRRQWPPRAVAVFVARPGAQHLRTADRVAVIELGDVADDREAPIVLEVRCQGGQPRLGQRLVDGLQQRPHQPLGRPRIGVVLDPRRRRERDADQRPREREVDVGADTIAAARACPERA